eukprot:Clim_evm16s224 gene=Clim_evmTU16s224
MALRDLFRLMNPRLILSNYNRAFPLFARSPVLNTSQLRTMTKLPKVAARKPAKVSVEAGKDYYWCRCGLSKNQPFCDGSHAGTAFKPMKFTPDESKDVFLCQCKKTGNQPFCDGTHAKIKDSEVGDIEDLAGGKVQAAGSRGDPESTPEEPTIGQIKALARGEGLHGHGEMVAMGVPRPTLPQWDDIQIITAQMATKPLMEDVPVKTELVIGPRAKKPLTLKIPLFVTDMSFGAISEEAKTALARGAEAAGTGICSGEGGSLPEEQQNNSRYFYELASAEFGYSDEVVKKAQAFHFKGGQGAKTGTGGHLPGAKVKAKIAQIRGLKEGEDAISPPTFKELHSAEDFKKVADHVRDITGGIPIGFKLSAQHIEKDIDFALAASADYIIIDGRGGGTGAAPAIFRDHISVPTIPALARARRHLDAKGVGRNVTLIATGGLRIPADFVKALALGADGIAVANSALQSIGCIAARMCNTNMCPAGIATMDPKLRVKVNVEKSAKQLTNFFEGSVHQMQLLARACGHKSFSDFCLDDLVTWKKDMHYLSGVPYAGVL